MYKSIFIALTALIIIALIAASSMAEELQRAPVSGRALTPDAPQHSIRGMTSAAPTVASATASASASTSTAPVGASAIPVRKRVKVALLLPLTGRHGEMGRALQDAASVALFDKYAQLSRKQQEVQVELLPKDTGDSPELARKAAEEAIAAGLGLDVAHGDQIAIIQKINRP